MSNFTYCCRWEFEPEVEILPGSHGSEDVIATIYHPRTADILASATAVIRPRRPRGTKRLLVFRAIYVNEEWRHKKFGRDMVEKIHQKTFELVDREFWAVVKPGTRSSAVRELLEDCGGDWREEMEFVTEEEGECQMEISRCFWESMGYVRWEETDRYSMRVRAQEHWEQD